MGCFSSRVDGTNNHTNAANSNNHSATTNIDPASSTAALASSHAQQPAGNTNRPNKALKYIRPRRDCVPPPNPSITNWTESLLEQERNAFWATRTETQTEGDQEIWRGLQRTVGHLRDGDLKSAQTYFNASDLNCPTGNVLDEVYDAHGYKYEIPAWVVMTPASLHYADSPVEDMRPTTAGSNANDKPESGDAESAAFRVRCRFPLGKDVFITVREQELVSSMVRKIRLQRTDIPQSTPLRIVHVGRVYRETDPLESNPNWRKGNTLTINVLEDPRAIGWPSSSALLT